jgi:hypothetical protein
MVKQRDYSTEFKRQVVHLNQVRSEARHSFSI